MFVDTLRSQPFLSPEQAQILDRYRELLISSAVPDDLTQPAADYLEAATDQCVAIADDETQVAEVTELDLPRMASSHEELRSALASSSWWAANFNTRFSITNRILANYTGLALAQHDSEAAEGELRRAPIMAHLQAQFCTAHVLEAAAMLLKSWFPEEPSVLEMAARVDAASDLSTPLILSRGEKDLKISLRTELREKESNPDAATSDLSQFWENVELGDPADFAYNSLIQLGIKLRKLTDEEMHYGSSLARKIANFLLRATQLRTSIAAEMHEALVNNPLARNYIFLYDSLPVLDPGDRLTEFVLRAQKIGRLASQS